MKWNSRLMSIALGTVTALALVVALMALFDTTEQQGVSAPDGSPSAGPGD